MSVFQKLKKRLLPPSSKSFHERMNQEAESLQELTNELKSVNTVLENMQTELADTARNRIQTDAAIDTIKQKTEEIRGILSEDAVKQIVEEVRKTLSNQTNVLQQMAQAINLQHEHLLGAISGVQGSANGIQWSLDEMTRKNEMMFWLSKMKKDESLQSTQRRIWQEMGRDEGSVGNVQKVIFNIFEQFVKICEENKLQYWLLGGSLLGAVRHKGFIPWDDDADVGMMRKDYLKLKNILKTTGCRYQIVDYYSLGIPGDFGRIPKLRDTQCTVPIYLDVFPFDWCEEGSEGNIQSYAEIRGEIEDAVKSVTDVFANSTPVEDVKLKNQIDEVFDRYMSPSLSDGKYLHWAYDLFFDPKFCYWTKDDIFPLRTMEFNGLTVSVPNDYIYMLEFEYGKWLGVPRDIYADFHSVFFGYTGREKEIIAFLEQEQLKKQKESK